MIPPNIGIGPINTKETAGGRIAQALRTNYFGQMSTISVRYFVRAIAGSIFGILLAAITVAAVNFDVGYLEGMPIPLTMYYVLTFQFVLVVLPFVGIAFVPWTGRMAWLAAIALTALVWGLLVLDPIIRGGGDANLGLYLLVIVSPAIVFGGALAADSWARHRTDH